jgi:hypothetical protein
VIAGTEARLKELSAETIIKEIIENTPVPGGDYRSS